MFGVRSDTTASVLAAVVCIGSAVALWSCSISDDAAQDSNTTTMSSVVNTATTGIQVLHTQRVSTLEPVDTQLAPGVKATTATAPDGETFVVVQVRITNNSSTAWIPARMKVVLHTTDGSSYDSYANSALYVPKITDHFLNPGSDLDTAFIFAVPSDANPVSITYTNNDDTGEFLV